MGGFLFICSDLYRQSGFMRSMSPPHLKSRLFHSEYVAPSSSSPKVLEKYEYRDKSRRQRNNVLQGEPASLNTRGLPWDGSGHHWNDESGRDGDDEEESDDDEGGSSSGGDGRGGWGGNAGWGGSSGGTVVSTGTSTSSGPIASGGTSGSDGTSGSNGTSGSDGTSGSNGTSGSDGTSGSNGSNGTSGSGGTSGSSGTTGNSGMGGYAGGWNGSRGGYPDNDMGGCSMCTIDDNDPRVRYTGLWVINATRKSTTHSTVSEGSTVSLRFNGSSIVVFGTVPESDGLEPPAAAYFLDKSPPSIMTLPNATANVPNQPLYASPQLSSNEEHRLFINVTKAHAPYTLAGFFIVPQFLDSNSTSTQNTPSPTTSPTSTSSLTIPNTSRMTSSKATSIVAGVLGSLVFLFVVGAVIFLILRWRMNSRRELSERLVSESSESKPDTIYSTFTTTESILRNDPSIWYLSPSYISSGNGSSQASQPSEASLSPSPSSSKSPSTSTSSSLERLT